MVQTVCVGGAVAVDVGVAVGGRREERVRTGKDFGVF